MYSVIIADDVADMRLLLGKICELLGFTYVEATKGEQVIELLQDEESEFHLVLLDINLPGIDGITTLSRIRKIKPDLKVCMISGDKQKETITKAIQLGGNDYIVKPIDISVVQDKLRKLMGMPAEGEFMEIETDLKAAIPGLPLAIDFRVVRLSEIGLVMESVIPLQENEDIKLRIPKLIELSGMEEPLRCKIVSCKENKKEHKHIVEITYVGLHENLRSKIRSITIKGEALHEKSA